MNVPKKQMAKLPRLARSGYRNMQYNEAITDKSVLPASRIFMAILAGLKTMPIDISR